MTQQWWFKEKKSSLKIKRSAGKVQGWCQKACRYKTFWQAITCENTLYPYISGL